MIQIRISDLKAISVYDFAQIVANNKAQTTLTQHTTTQHSDLKAINNAQKVLRAINNRF